MHKNITYKDITIVSIAAIAVTLCFGIMAGLVGNLQLALAQEQTPTESLLGDVNATIISVSGLMATAMSIVVGVVAWLRAKFGDKIVSDGANEWIQDIFEKIRKKDDDVRDIFRQVLEKHAEIDVVLGVVKNSSPELGAQIDEAMPQLDSKLKEINTKIAHWQDEADKLYAVSPKDDPVGK